jgi:2-isopropylmalate synthase
MIRDSIAYLKPRMDEVLDAEHFFRLSANREYALATLKAAAEAGADWLILCDTNGGTLPPELVEIRVVSEVRTAGHPRPQRRGWWPTRWRP